MTGSIEELRERVRSYFDGINPPFDELPKHRIVRETCEAARRHGIDVAELDAWARTLGQPSVAVCRAKDLDAVQKRWNLPGGVGRWRRRLERDTARLEGS